MNNKNQNSDETSLETLELLVSAACDLSNGTVGRPSNWRGQQASLAFAKIGVNGMTFLRLVPGSNFFAPARKLVIWDLSAVAAQCRSLIEAYYVLCYLIHEPSDQSEREFRQMLWEYHEGFERHEMLRIGIPNSEHIARYRLELESRRLRLHANEFFKALMPRHQDHLTKGKEFKLDSSIELSRKAGISENYYRSNYRYCSAFAHSAPFSISQLDAFRADTDEARQVMQTLVSVSCGYIAFAIRDFTSLFPDQIVKMTSEIRETIHLWEGVLKWERSPDFNGHPDAPNNDTPSRAGR